MKTTMWKADLGNGMYKNPILYAGLFQVIKRGTAKILEETEEGIFLQDTVGGAYMMASGHPDTDIRWLKKHEASDYHLFSVFHLETAEFIKDTIYNILKEVYKK